MKRLLTMLLAVLMVFCMFSCDKEGDAKPVYEYYENGNLKESIEYDEYGGKLVNEYREDGKVSKETHYNSDGGVWITTYEYDENANLIKSQQICEKYEVNDVTLYQYFENGNRKTEEYYSNEKLQYRVNYSEDGSYYDTLDYDDEGNVTSTIRTNVTRYDDGSYLETTEVDETTVIVNGASYRTEGYCREEYFDKKGTLIYSCSRTDSMPLRRLTMMLDENTEGIFSLGNRVTSSKNEFAPAIIWSGLSKLGITSKGGNYSETYLVDEYFSEKSEKVDVDGKTYTKISLFFRDSVLLQETILDADSWPEEDYELLNILIRNVIYLPNGEVLYDTQEDDEIYEEVWLESASGLTYYTYYNSIGKIVDSKILDSEGNVYAGTVIEYDDNGNCTEYKYDFERLEEKKCYNKNGVITYLALYNINGEIYDETLYNDDGSKVWRQFFQVGILSFEERTFKDGTRVYARFNSVGRKLTEDYYDKDGKLTVTITYANDGKTIKGETTYAENGDKKYQRFDKNGRIDYEEYILNDGTKSIAFYKNGMKDYEFCESKDGIKISEINYYDDGKIMYEYHYDKDGELISATFYDENGNVIS